MIVEANDVLNRLYLQHELRLLNIEKPDPFFHIRGELPTTFIDLNDFFRGRLLEGKIDDVQTEYVNKKATRMVVFARKGDAEVFGVDALEGLGLEIDPITKQLKKAEALLALVS